MKIILFIVYVIFLSANTNAQEIKKQEKAGYSKVQLGVLAGPNITTVVKNYYSAADNAKLLIGYSAGAFFQYKFNNVSALYTGVFYTRKGVTEQVSYYEFHTGRTVWGTDYLRFYHYMFPLLYKRTFNRFFFNAGVFAGYAVKLAAKNEVLGFSWPANTYTINPDYTQIQTFNKPFYKGVAAGAGFIFLRTQHLDLSFELNDYLELTTAKSFNGANKYRRNTPGLSFSFGYKL